MVVTEDTANLDDKTLILDVKRLDIRKRYVFLSITVTVESFVVISIITEKYHSRGRAVSQSSDVVSLVRSAS